MHELNVTHFTKLSIGKISIALPQIILFENVHNMRRLRKKDDVKKDKAF